MGKLIVLQPEAVELSQDRFERDFRFQPGQVRAEAGVGTGTERDMSPCPPDWIEVVRNRECLLITIC